MSIKSVRLQNVRLHQDSSYEFSGGVNVLIGPNACGKTTILESIAITMIGKVPGVRAKEMLRQDSEWMRIDTLTDKQHRTVKYEPLKQSSKYFELDNKPHKRLSYQNSLPIVWFDPEQLRLLRGSPTRRRDYMDQLLTQLDPQYGQSLRQLNRALLQRNALLKKKSFTKDQLFVWNIRFAQHAKYVVEERFKLAEMFNQTINQTYQELSSVKKAISCSYSSPLQRHKYDEQLLINLEKNLQRDLATGYTSFGPHREDLIFRDQNEVDLSQSASRGEIRSLVLSLKTIEVRLLADSYGFKPLLLFDDVFSELDGARRHAFTDSLSDTQTIVTTTDADVVTKDFAQHAKVIAV